MKSWQTKNGISIHKILSGRSGVFLVSTKERHLLVDTSVQMDSKRLVRRLTQCKIRSLDALILTHTHFDHASNAALLKEKCGCQIIVHRHDAGYLKTGDSPIPRGTNGFTSAIYRLYETGVQKIPHLFHYNGVAADILVDEQYSLYDLGFRALLLSTPGHSAGSISLVIDDEIAIVGDALMGQLPWTIFPVFADDPAEVIRSWQKLLHTGCSLFLPAHGRAIGRTTLEKELIRKTKPRLRSDHDKL